MNKHLIRLLTLGLSLVLVNGSLIGCSNKGVNNNNNNNQQNNNNNEPEIKDDEVPATLIDIPTPPVVPEGMETNELSYVYASISVDLMAMGYQSFTAKAQSESHCEYGIGYTDCIEGYQFTNSDKFYFSSGFISFSANGESSFEKDKHVFLTPVDNEKKEVTNEKYGFVVGFNETNIPAGHFIVNDKYIVYRVTHGNVDLTVLDNKPSSYDLSLGSIYDYSHNQYEFIAYNDISSEPLEYVPLVDKIDTKALKDDLHKILDRQEENGYRLEQLTITYISLDSLNALRGLLSQEDSLNGFSLDYLDSLNLDASKQYIQFNEDGSITLKDLPPDPKIWIDYLVDVLVYGGLAGIVILSGVVFGPLGQLAVLHGAIGAGIQYFSETVIQGKHYNEVEWGSFFVRAAAGTLKGLARFTMPGIGGIFVEGIIGGLASSTIAFMHGEDKEDIINEGFKGATISMLLASIARIIVGVTSIKEPAGEKGDLVVYKLTEQTGGDELTKELVYVPQYAIAETPTHAAVVETVTSVTTRESLVQSVARQVAEEMEMGL